MTEDSRYPSQLAERFQIRLPDGMRDAIKVAADVSGRSMNAEIIHRLKGSLEGIPTTRLYLDLPEALEREISLDAMARNVEMDERVIEVLSAAYRAAPLEFRRQLDRLESEIVRNADLSELVVELKKNLERDFVLYYGKVTQISQFVDHLLTSAGNTLTEGVQKSAKDLQALSEAELKILRERYEDGLFWVKRRENEARNAQEFDQISKQATDLAAQLGRVALSGDGSEAEWEELTRKAQGLSEALKQLAESDEHQPRGNLSDIDAPIDPDNFLPITKIVGGPDKS